MTMQVGMVGIDGIVLASDKVWILARTRVTQTVTKLKYDSERGIGVRCAEADLSLNIASRIVECLPDGNHESPCLLLEQYAKEIMSGFDTPTFRRFGRPLQSQCLVALNKPLGLFSLKAGLEGVKCQKIDDKTRVGDMENSALFFLESYYSSRPVKQLAFLAAHIVLEAARRNPAGVGGLEVLICEDGGVRMLDAERIAEIKQRSDALHAKVEQKLFS